ncbi:MAG: PDZ domain-containing protein, partial [Planctomycetota bacterium]|nr:PDZ domain-containing protein [Planctomycetota bacterium]
AFTGRTQGDVFNKAPKRLSRCVVVSVEKGSQAEVLGLKIGDVLESIAGKTPLNRQQFRTLSAPLKQENTYLRALFKRGKKSLKLELHGPKPGFRIAPKTVYPEPSFR